MTGTSAGLDILYSFPHRLGDRGIGTTAAQQAAGLTRRGHRVHVIAASVAADAAPTHDPRETMVLAGRRIPHRALPGDLALARHDRLVAAALDRQHIDLVHTWPLATLRTAQAARRRGVAVVREVPNTHTANAYAVAEELSRQLEVELPRRNSHRPRPRRLTLEEAEYAAVTGLLVPSDHVASTFLERGVSPQLLLRHQYGYDPVRFSPRPRDRDAPLTVCFVGSGEPRKGLHVALESWRKSRVSREGRLLVVGEIVPAYRRALGDLLRSPGVTAVGYTDDVPGLLAASDALVLPSFEEGSALVTYEAQGAGAVPLVSSAAGAVCTPGVTGLVHAPGDVAALATHFDELADPETRARMRASVLEHRHELTWDAAAQVLEDCYLQAVATARRQS